MLEGKKGLLGKIFLILIAFLAIAYLSRAETAISIVNVTITINSSDIAVNLSNSIYSFNNTASVVNIQQNYTITYSLNATNQTITTNATCNNTSISLSCSCPLCPNIDAVVNCTQPSEVDLKNETKTELYNHYVANLNTKLEETGNKVAQDVLFKLEPTRVELESCRDKAVNATEKQLEAERQRDKFAADNVALGVSYEQEKSDNRWLMTTIIVMFAAIIALLGFVFGFDWIERFRFKGY